MSDTIAISLTNISYKDQDLPILKNITGSFPEGKITALVGPSGAGKSTLFKLCNGLRSPVSGQIQIRGKDIEQYHPVELRRLVGMALQNAPMIAGDVRSNLALPRKLQGKDLMEDEAKQLLEMVGLESHLLDRKVNDLSGGQRQKVSIARTLVNQPAILLLDEITSSLDPVSTQEIEELIATINREQETTIIWITHNLQQARSMGDYAWVMMNGELIESGEIQILTSPQTEKVQRFIEGEET